MAPVLAVAFKAATADLAPAIILLLAYGARHCLLLVLAGACTGLVQHYLDWNERSRGAAALRKVCGLLVIVVGLYLVWSAP
jgi:cytochrome c-type biogenesis protein